MTHICMACCIKDYNHTTNLMPFFWNSDVTVDLFTLLDIISKNVSRVSPNDQTGRRLNVL